MRLKTLARPLVCAALLLANLAPPVQAADRKPLVLNGTQQQQLQSADKLALPNVTGSTQCLQADSGGALTGTGAPFSAVN